MSESVLEGIARGLQLDEAERAHLFDLVRAAGPTGAGRRRPTQQRVHPGVQRILDSMTGTPAFVLNGRLDILAANDLGYALYALSRRRKSSQALALRSRIVLACADGVDNKTVATRLGCAAATVGSHRDGNSAYVNVSR